MKRHALLRQVVETGLAALVCGGFLMGALGCYHGPKSGFGFRLPQGDADRGRQAFIDLKCAACHTIAGEALPAPTIGAGHVVAIGGEVGQVKTYGELVSLIIHPPGSRFSGRDSLPSAEAVTGPRMPTVNDRMTVRQMIDLVVFLQPHYKELHPDFTDPRALPFTY
jgi:hypothetical protein